MRRRENNLASAIAGETAAQFVEPRRGDRDIALLGVRVPKQHATRGITVLGDASAEGFVAAADALLYEAFKTLPMERSAPDGTGFPELHDRARDALRGLLAGFVR